MKLRRIILVALAFALALAPAAPVAVATDLQVAPRQALPREPLQVQSGYDQQLVVKFSDGFRARAQADGAVASLAGGDLTPLDAVAAAHGMVFTQVLRLPAAVITGMEERAAERSGRAQPDLAGMMLVDIPAPTEANLVAAGEALLSLRFVEWVDLDPVMVPPPTDIPPTTSDLTSGQGYRPGNPGVNSNYINNQGYTGQGVRLSDCEYGWNATHEDVNEISLNPEPGQTVHPTVFANLWDQHGAAVSGVAVGMPNAYGISGMAPDVDFHSYTEWSVEQGLRRATCIANAVANSVAGDVVLLEMQTGGVGGGLVPAEYDLTVWTIVKNGTDAGVVVVAAAGNGNVDLDGASYASYLGRGDSGAIIVGAGSATGQHNKLSFSTYGSRVDVQAWGEAVQTIGYGDIQFNGADQDQWYTATFSGTSSASSIVAPCAALIQSAQLALIGTPLTSQELRALFVSTGWPQGTGGNIGPAVNLRAAYQAQFPVSAPVAQVGTQPIVAVEPNPFRGRTAVRFELPSAATVDLSVYDVSGRIVRSLVARGVRGAGSHAVPWDGRDDAGRRLASGVYFARLSAGERTESKRVVLLP